jgi:septum formation protein
MSAADVGDGSAPRVVLASQSPRRHDLLRLIGLAHAVRPADIDESAQPGEPPVSCVERLARTKANRIAALERDALVIGADTIVVIDDQILNKPRDERDARAMLRALQGRTHAVHTAVCVVWNGRVASGVEPVGVRFRALSDAEIEAYVATGEPMDKAGAYGIQGYGATIVEAIDGDFFAVMGLPLVRLVRLMGALGVEYNFGKIGVRGSGFGVRNSVVSDQ